MEGTIENNVFHSHYRKNGTLKTLCDLTGGSEADVINSPRALVEAMRETVALTKILPAAINYYETSKYVFVHGWLPCREATFGSPRHEGFKKNTYDPDAFAEHVKNLRETRLVVFVLGKGPRSGLVNIFVEARHTLPDLGQSERELERFHLLLHVGFELFEHADDLIVDGL